MFLDFLSAIPRYFSVASYKDHTCISGITAFSVIIYQIDIVEN